ncbi:specifically androgen-regulated gene protein isoform X1 [Ambystoma mexicanum]|uniref:specifically androgen-regulated gene protein isoform X1 n=1 Tax=Ambystoma mexicanum TaxID=8296 RepID=UPI0037E97232
MPEKALGSVNAGMASAVSAGSCDSVASITSNHSALSDDSYDYLSAEERDVLMYLEETIESLDADGDSGLSADERFEEAPVSAKNSISKNPYQNEAFSTGNSTQQSTNQNERNSLGALGWGQDGFPKPAFNSLPKNVMIPRAELAKTVPVQSAAPPTVEASSAAPEKPKRWSFVLPKEQEPLISELGLIPPPESFRDMQPIVKSASFERDTAGENLKSDNVDGTNQSGVVVGKPFVSSPKNLSPPKAFEDVPPAALPQSASAAEPEPQKDTVTQRPLSRQQPNHLPPVLSGNTEPQKESEALRSPRWQTVQTPHNSAFAHTEPAKLPMHLIPNSPQPPPISPPPSQLPPAYPAPSQLPPAYPPPSQLPPTSPRPSQLPPTATQPSHMARTSLTHLQTSHTSPQPEHMPFTSAQSTPVSPAAQQPTVEVTQLPKERFVFRPLSPPMTGPVPDQNNTTSNFQAQREKSASQEIIQEAPRKTVDPPFKHGPPTHPKPLKLPAHIIVKTSHANNNLEPQQRCRTRSLIDVPLANRNRPSSMKTHLIKDQMTTRQEALEKLKLSQETTNLLGENTIKSSAVTKKEQSPLPQSATEKTPNALGAINQPHQNTGLQDKTNVNTNHIKSGGVWSRQFPVPQEKNNSLTTSPANPSVLPKTTEMPIPQSSEENSSIDGRVHNNRSSPKSAWWEKNTFSVSPEKVHGGLRSREFSFRRTEIASDKENPSQIGRGRDEQSSAKSGLQEKTNALSVNPEKVLGGQKSKEISPPHIAIEREPVSVITKGLSSSQQDLSSRPGYRFTQGSVPGLKEMNFKSNTLERSGIGWSNDNKGGNETNQDTSSSSLFRKPTSALFTPSFLKKNRPRPASMGGAVDFKAIQESVANPANDVEPAAKPEIRRSSPFSLFSSRPRPNSLTSVKITPKNSTDEHREALKKLGLLQE